MEVCRHEGVSRAFVARNIEYNKGVSLRSVIVKERCRVRSVIDDVFRVIAVVVGFLNSKNDLPVVVWSKVKV